MRATNLHGTRLLVVKEDRLAHITKIKLKEIFIRWLNFRAGFLQNKYTIIPYSAHPVYKDYSWIFLMKLHLLKFKQSFKANSLAE